MESVSCLRLKRASFALAGLCCLGVRAFAQQAFTWQQVKEKFEAANPTLAASRLNIDESHAAEITADLRPNPDFTLSTDGTQLTPYQGGYRPFAGTQFAPSFSYLHEREHKRELRLQGAKKSTDIAVSTFGDQERNLLFTLRNAFVQVLAAKAVLENANENLDYWDRELMVNRDRYNAGDLSLIDLNRLELERFQFESDQEAARTNVRTNKIELLNLLNERTPVEQFDVAGNFDFDNELMPLQQFRDLAEISRPDLKAAAQNVELARVNHQLAIANGSTDPTFSGWWTHNPSFNNPYDNNTIGASVSIPLRLFDRNQGEKARTQIDIGAKQRLQDAAEAQALSDVDSAYATIQSALTLLRTRAKYLQLATDNRDRMSRAYQNGGASLLDLLDSEKAYRDTRLAYINLIGAYLTAAAQMNLAVGREILQ